MMHVPVEDCSLDCKTFCLTYYCDVNRSLL